MPTKSTSVPFCACPSARPQAQCAAHSKDHRVGYSSGQRGQTVNLLAKPSKVRILPLPPVFRSPPARLWLGKAHFRGGGPTRHGAGHTDMSDVKFDCPNCTQRIGAPPAMAGRAGVCPNCKSPVEVPMPDEMVPAETTSVKTTAPSPQKKIVMKRKPSAKHAASVSATRRPSPRATGKSKPAAAPTDESKSATASTDEPSASGGDVSEKSRTVALLLCFFLGGIGVHRFYVGKVGTGIAQIVTLGGFGIWVWIDFIMIICGAFKDKPGLPLKKW
jgi:hypothetical protein